MSGPAYDPRPPSFRRSLKAQLRTLSALMIREGVSKFGHENFGFFWVLGEPLLFASAVSIMWSINRNAKFVSVGLLQFVLTGYCALILWRHIVGHCSKALSKRAALLYHNNIKPMDLMLAIGFLEILGVFTAFLVAYLPLAAFDLVLPIHDPLRLIGGFLFVGWFATSFGLCLAAISEMVEFIEKFVQAFLYVTLPLTGVFTLVDWLPPKAQKVLLFSPMVHAVEMIRSSILDEDVTTVFDPRYLLIVCLVQTAIGFLLMSHVQKHIEG